MNFTCRAALPACFAAIFALSACGGGGGGDDKAPLLTPSGRMSATLPLADTDVLGVWSAEGIMGVSLTSNGQAVQRNAVSNDAAVPVPRVQASWRIVGNVLIFKKDGLAAQDECIRVRAGNAPLVLDCMTIGGEHDGVRAALTLDTVDLPAELPGVWVSGGLTVSLATDGRFTASADGMPLAGTWRVDGLRLTLRSDGSTSTCDFTGRAGDAFYMSCLFAGERSELLTIWYPPEAFMQAPGSETEVPQPLNPLQIQLLELINSAPASGV